MITVIFACCNRLGKTRNCIQSLTDGNPSTDFSFVVFDDGSTDGTKELLKVYRDGGKDITVLSGDGNAFWAGGMRMAIAAAKEKADADYYLMVNDDVDFYPGAAERLVAEYEAAGSTQEGLALVGATCGADREFTYGGIRYGKGIRYVNVTPAQEDRTCDSFNMNCLLLDKKTFMEAPDFDEHYIHSLADFDYGLALKRKGVLILSAPFFVGMCERNSAEGSWTDRTLSRRERLRRKESPKGAPFAPWFYFLKKNFGFGNAVRHGFTPYIRIILGR